MWPMTTAVGPRRKILAIGCAIASFLLVCSEVGQPPPLELSPGAEQPDERGVILPQPQHKASLDAEDPAVFQALLNYLDASPSKPGAEPARLFLVADQTHYFQLSRDLVLVKDTLQADPRGQRLPPALFYQFSQRNFRPQLLPRFRADRPIELLSAQRWRQIQGSARRVELGQAEFPEAQGVYFLGLPGYNEERYQALAFAGVIWQWSFGWGSLFYLEKSDAGAWEVRFSWVLFRY